MTIEVHPVGMKCNLSCPYCYQNPIRDAGNFTKGYDLQAMKEGLEKQGGKFTLFGGEALLMPLEDMEELVQWGYEKFGGTGLQTNATLLTEEHAKLFAKYNTYVGISMDGPGELNDTRWAGTLESTRKNTQKSMEAIDILLKHGITPSLIVTLSQRNGLPDKRSRLKKWFKELDEKGISSVRLHLMEVDHQGVRDNMALTDEENIDALLDLAKFEESLKNIRFDLFKDIRKLLLGQDQSVTCVWNACDPYTTRAVQGVDGNGEASNCGRTNKEGVTFHKAQQPGHERQLALYNTPWEKGGCKGCKFWIFCKGECPGTGETADWRNRSDQCVIWYALFQFMERKLLREGHHPVSLDEALPKLEKRMYQAWANGHTMQIHEAIRQEKNGSPINSFPHHSDSGSGSHRDWHGDRPHGDSDSHRDSGPKQSEAQHQDWHKDKPHGDSG